MEEDTGKMTFLKLRHLSTMLLLGILASSHSAIAAGSKKPAGGVASMPSGLRKEAAFHLLSKYRTEGTGGPEISAKPFLVEGATPSFRLRVRYPANGGMHCFTIQSGPADEEGNFRFSVETNSGSAVCSGDEKIHSLSRARPDDGARPDLRAEERSPLPRQRSRKQQPQNSGPALVSLAQVQRKSCQTDALEPPLSFPCGR
jgi:hypothetical protein